MPFGPPVWFFGEIAARAVLMARSCVVGTAHLVEELRRPGNDLPSTASSNSSSPLTLPLRTRPL